MIFRAFGTLLNHSGSLIHQRKQATRRSERSRQIRRQRTQCKRRTKRAGKQYESHNQRRSVRIHGTHPNQAFRHIDGSGNRSAQRHHKESSNRGKQHHQYRTQSCKTTILRTQSQTFAPQRKGAPSDGSEPGTTLTEADDFADTTHIVKHFVVEGGGFLAKFRTDASHRRREQLWQYDADCEVRDDQRHREGCTQGEQCECIDDGGHNSDDDRADGVREEDFQQLHVGGDQRDQVALTFARKFGRGETPQGREGFRTEQCEQPERHIVVHELFGIAHAAADQRADGHGGERCGNAEIPDGRADGRESRRNAEYRQESGGEVAERAANACDDHVLTQRPDFLQQPRDKARRRHTLYVRFTRIGHTRHGFGTLAVRFGRIGHIGCAS